KTALFHLAANLPAMGIPYGSERFYQTLEAAFPISKDTETRSEEPVMPRFATSPQNEEERAFVEEAEKEMPDFVPSAPVSRPSWNANGKHSQTSVHLTKDERDLARSLGMSEVDYARNKLLLEERRAAGLLQDDR